MSWWRKPRAHALHLFGWLLILLFVLVQGCSGDTIEMQLDSQNVSVNLPANSAYSAESLTIEDPLLGRIPVTSNAIEVSRPAEDNKSANLVTVSDQQDTPVLLGLATYDNNVNLSALSTAASLVYLFPGICPATDTDKKTLINKIESNAEVVKLANYIEQGIVTGQNFLDNPDNKFVELYVAATDSVSASMASDITVSTAERNTSYIGISTPLYDKGGVQISKGDYTTSGKYETWEVDADFVAHNTLPRFIILYVVPVDEQAERKYFDAERVLLPSASYTIHVGDLIGAMFGGQIAGYGTSDFSHTFSHSEPNAVVLALSLGKDKDVDEEPVVIGWHTDAMVRSMTVDLAYPIVDTIIGLYIDNLSNQDLQHIATILHSTGTALVEGYISQGDGTLSNKDVLAIVGKMLSECITTIIKMVSDYVSSAIEYIMKTLLKKILLTWEIASTTGDIANWLISINRAPDYNEIELYSTSELELPIAKLTTSPDPPTGKAPLGITFKAGESYDPDNASRAGAGIEKYEFDFGDGQGWHDLGLLAVTDNTYGSSGQYTCKLRVTDDEGDKASAEVVVNVQSISEAGDVTYTVHNEPEFAPGETGTIGFTIHNGWHQALTWERDLSKYSPYLVELIPESSDANSPVNIPSGDKEYVSAAIEAPSGDGDYSTTVWLKTNHPSQNPIKVKLGFSVAVNGDLSVSPGRINLEMYQDDNSAYRTLVLKNNSNTALEWRGTKRGDATNGWLVFKDPDDDEYEMLTGNKIEGTLATGQSIDVNVRISPDAKELEEGQTYTGEFMFNGKPVGAAAWTTGDQTDVTLKIKVRDKKTILNVIPKSINVDVDFGESTYSYIKVQNPGDLSFYWQAYDNKTWIELEQTYQSLGSGEEQLIKVWLNDNLSLQAGEHEGKITVIANSAQGSPAIIPVVVTVKGTPDIEVTQTNFSNQLLEGQAGSDTFHVQNKGTEDLTFYVETDCTWLSVNHLSQQVLPPNGSTEVTISYPAGNAPGYYAASGSASEVRVIATNDPDEPTTPIQVELTVKAKLGSDPDSIQLVGASGTGWSSSPFVLVPDQDYLIRVFDSQGTDVAAECEFDLNGSPFYEITAGPRLTALGPGPEIQVTVTRDGDSQAIEFYVKVWE